MDILMVHLLFRICLHLFHIMQLKSSDRSRRAVQKIATAAQFPLPFLLLRSKLKALGQPQRLRKSFPSVAIFSLLRSLCYLFYGAATVLYNLKVAIIFRSNSKHTEKRKVSSVNIS